MTHKYIRDIIEKYDPENREVIEEWAKKFPKIYIESQSVRALQDHMNEGLKIMPRPMFEEIFSYFFMESPKEFTKDWT